MKKFRLIVVAIIILAIIFVAFNYRTPITTGAKNMFSGIFFIDSSTEQQLKANYATAQKSDGKIKILIVPGHDNQNFGTIFKGMTEASVNLKLGKELFGLLRKEKEFNVTLLRDETGYNREFLDYLLNNKKEIERFKEENKKIMGKLMQQKLIESNVAIVHNFARPEVSRTLYGINKWANDNGIDVILHIHFNDYPGRRYNQPGKYSGFSIYVPEKQYSNAKGSIALAKSALKQLSKYFAISDMPKENTGIIEDQELIAIGSYNTLDSAVLLIEYGYIYESQFVNSGVRDLATKELATQTYLGIKNFFEETNKDDLATLPRFWPVNLRKNMLRSVDAFALQMALSLEGLYPPADFTKNDCPINGNFKSCTLSAVKSFQKKYNIEPAFGFVGSLTRGKLNELYGN